jgi:hypothetical protein
MGQAGGHPDFPEEPIGADVAGQFGLEDLDGDPAVVPEVVCEKDDGHAAFAEFALEPVPLAYGRLKSLLEGGHPQ